MGDSITEGQGVTPSHRWTDLISYDLHKNYLNTAINFFTLNSGISGENTRQALERFPRDLQAHQPDIVTIQFGFNDSNSWVTDRGHPRVSIEAFRANIIEMVERAALFGAKKIILSNNHRTLRNKVLLSGESLQQSKTRYDRVLEEIAKEKNILFCDIAAAFDKLDTETVEKYLIPYPDLLHLSREGHKYYAAQIQPLIEESIDHLITNI